MGSKRENKGDERLKKMYEQWQLTVKENKELLGKK